MNGRNVFPAPRATMRALELCESLTVGCGGGLEVECPGRADTPVDAVAEVLCFECEESEILAPGCETAAVRFARAHRACECRNPWADDEESYMTDGEGE